MLVPVYQTTQHCIPEHQNLTYCTPKKLALIYDNRELYSIEDVDYSPQNMTPCSMIVCGYQHLRQT